MQQVGFADEVSAEQVRQMVAAARRRCRGLAPLVVRLGPAQVQQEGVTLAVAPQGPLRWVRMALRGAIAEVWGPARVPQAAEAFWPHVSIAYSNRKGPAAPVIDRVVRVGALETVAKVADARLLELEREGHVYRWRTHAVVPLGTEGRSPRRGG